MNADNPVIQDSTLAGHVELSLATLDEPIVLADAAALALAADIYRIAGSRREQKPASESFTGAEK